MASSSTKFDLDLKTGLRGDFLLLQWYRAHGNIRLTTRSTEVAVDIHGGLGRRSFHLQAFLETSQIFQDFAGSRRLFMVSDP
jgi:hypothetical protein